MNHIIFELLISPFTTFDNYFVGYIIMAFLSMFAFRVAFKIVGNIGVRGEFGSFLHWVTRLSVFAWLWFCCCIIISLIKFIMKHIILVLIIFMLLIISFLFIKHICNCILNN